MFGWKLMGDKKIKIKKIKRDVKSSYNLSGQIFCDTE